MIGDVETYRDGVKWKTRVEGGDRGLATHDLKDDAVAEGREMAKERGVEHIVKTQDGALGDTGSHGNRS